MKIKIIKCNSDGYWYKDLIGKIVDITEKVNFIKKYAIHTKENYTYYIDFCDAEVLNIKDENKIKR